MDIIHKRDTVFNKTSLIVLVSVLAVLVVFVSQQLIPKIQLPVVLEKIDDWQYTTVPDIGNLTTPSDILVQITPLRVVAFLAFFVLYALLPISIKTFIYRFFGFIIRRFRQDLFFGTKGQIVRMVVYLLTSLATIGASVLLAINFPWFQITVIAAAALVVIVMTVLWLVTLVYIPMLLFIWIVRRVKKENTGSLKEKLLKTVAASVVSFGFGFVIFYLVGSMFISAFMPPMLTNGGGGGGPVSLGGLAPGVGSFKSIGISPMRYELADNIGFSTGGAKDVNNFRVNLENDYLPLVTDVTYEGLFYDYYFDTGQKQACNQLFCPSYSYAISEDPISSEKEYFLSVGLNSGIKQADFQRKKLNLVIVLDISGSMGSPFNKYYYDQFGNRCELEESEISNESKMMVANKAVVALLDHLEQGDRYGMVLFNNQASLAKPMRLVEATDIESIKRHVLEIMDSGGTNMESGYREGTKLLEEFKKIDRSEYENRIIFLTDAQPNIGTLDEKGLLGMTETNADNNIFTTFIGIGVDFNTELIEFITKIKGSNYYSVHSGKDFNQRMDEGFEYMVTPLVFDLSLRVGSDDFDIEKVYGSPEADLATGEIMKVNTLFPSERREEGVKGGIVVLKLRKLTNSASPVLRLTASYTDRTGKPLNNEATATISDQEPDFYENTGIRKAILLSRYANLMKVWMSDERENRQHDRSVVVPSISSETGILIPEKIQLSKWERTSVPLKVSPVYKEFIGDFRQYFVAEKSALGDDTLSKEVTILDKLLSN